MWNCSHSGRVRSPNAGCFTNRSSRRAGRSSCASARNRATPSRSCRSTAPASGRAAGSVAAGAGRPEGIHPISRYRNWASRCRTGRGRRRIGGFARRSSNTRPLPSIEIAWWCTICACVHLPGGARCQSASGRPANGPSTASGIAANPSDLTTVASSTFIPKIVRMNLLRRHPIALALIALLLLSALGPLPPLVDAVSGAPPADVDLVRPTLYTLLAPVSNVLDALTFLSRERAIAFLVIWVPALALWGLLRPGSPRRRLVAAVLAPLALILLAGAAVLLPRPVPRLV